MNEPEPKVFRTAGTGIPPDAQALIDSMVQENPGLSFIAIESKVRLIEAGIEVSLRLGGCTAVVVLDPTMDPEVANGFVANIPTAVMESVNQGFQYIETSHTERNNG